MSRVHLVTGAGSGIGAELARLLHERGDGLVLLARDDARAADLARDFPGATTVVADLEDPACLEGLRGSLPERLDSVVHSAGVVVLDAVADLDHRDLTRTLQVNLVSVAELTRVALPALRAARGQVVLVNSGSGLRANPAWTSYAASKFGLRALAEALRAEEAEHGVRVVSVYPGRTATRMQEQVHAQEGKPYDPAEWTSAATVAATVLHCLDLPEDATIPDVTIRPRA